MNFKLYDCDVGIKIASVRYNFEHVNEVSVEDPERNQLTRGANANNSTGLAYKDGNRDPKRWTMQIMGMTPALYTVLINAFKNQTRLDVFCAARSDGSSKMLREALLSNRPQQLTLDENPDSMNVSLEFVSFKSDEVHKS